MHRLRLLLVLAFVVVLGASVARSQDGTGGFNDQDKQSDHKSTQEKAKSNDSHRKHWWSPPHWLHKKHDNATSTTSTGKNPDSKTATTTNQTLKTSDNKIVAAANAPKTSSTSKTVTGARPTTKAVARTETARKGTAGNTQSRKTTPTTAHKKTVQHDCTPEQAKKGGCEVDKGSSHKGTVNPS
jgi:hypothetical protein